MEPNGKAASAVTFLLPSHPIPLPFPGIYSEISIIYNIDACMDLDQTIYQTQLQAIMERQAARQRERQALVATYLAEWAEAQPPKLPPDPSNRAAQAAYQMDLTAHHAYMRALEADPERYTAYTTALIAQTQALHAIDTHADADTRDMAWQIIAQCVADLIWPEAAGSKPRPDVPTTWPAGFSPRALDWITTAGVDAAKGQLQSFLSGPTSSPTS